MPVEIERKYLVNSNTWKKEVKDSFELKQGYLSTEPERTVRVRIKRQEAFLTIKGITKGLSRTEHEYPIPVEDAQTLLTMCTAAPIEKVRHLVEYAGLTWEIDVFSGANLGLVLAEVELGAEDQEFAVPDWVGEEVSDDPRYFNAQLYVEPFTLW